VIPNGKNIKIKMGVTKDEMHIGEAITVFETLALI
jgi:hypothetical protein